MSGGALSKERWIARHSKRPASHIWATITLVAFALLYGGSVREDYETETRILLLANTACCILPVVYLVFLRAAKLTYFTTTACIAALILQCLFFLFHAERSGMEFFLLVLIPTFLFFVLERSNLAYFGFPAAPPAPENSPRKHLEY